MDCWLYMVTHQESGRCYVGWCKIPPERRWSKHRSNAKRPKYFFHHSIKKYGAEAFDLNIVSHFDNPEEAKQAEIYWIARLREFGIELFNCTDGGDGCSGYKMTTEQRAKYDAWLASPKPSRVRNPGAKHNRQKRAREAARIRLESSLQSFRISKEAFQRALESIRRD